MQEKFPVLGAATPPPPPSIDALRERAATVLERALGFVKSTGDALALERAHVFVDLAKRKDRMMQALLDSAKALGGTLEPDAFLADECV